MESEFDVKILLKFVEPQFTRNTMNGEFYFAKNKYFIDLEEEQFEKGIGDSEEGVWSQLIKSSDYQIFIPLENGEEFELPFEKAYIKHSYSDLSKFPICCFVLLSLKNDFLYNPDENKFYLKPEIEEKLVEQFQGRDLIYIHNHDEFINRIDKILEDKEIGRMRGLVKYFDDKNESHPLPMDDFDKDAPRTLLYKRKFFEYQKEFRIVLKRPFETDQIFNIGNMKDIALNLEKVEVGKKLPLIYSYKRQNTKV
ncbi:hypothetical protein [Alkalihalobacillus sp. R86527]|uniref:hypothetical protein n=1 Tax=Alkalihalobacillus sp. R86527 TaxID=3093863 RepID=UPI00367209CE